jgi:tricorn protease
MKRSIFLGIAIIAVHAGLSHAQTAQPLLMREPALSRTQIVFSYAGDLWIVSREGGEALRLTNGPGTESSPSFSPDGKMVAFSGEYDGNQDVYIVPAGGGVPRRLTYHPADDDVAGWTPDGKQVLFVSGRSSPSRRFARLFTIGVDGVFPSEVPLPMGYEGAYSPDGKQLAYVPLPRGFSAWKRYRGGMATPIWIANLADSSITKVPRDDSNDFNPMWVGDKIFFLSDRNGPITLFSYDLKTRKVAQNLQNPGLDIKSAAAVSDTIVYEQFGSLNLFDLKSSKSRKVPISINADMLAVRPRFQKVGSAVRSAVISPTGARAAFEARGEILTVPAEKGDVRNLTNTPGVAERDPSWSPDGKWIAYFSDESGEYALHLRDQKGQGEVKKIPLGDPPSFFYSPVWSPDSKKIAYSDKRLNIWWADIEKGTTTKVDSLPRGGNLDGGWSPDSRWLVYAKPLRSWYRAIFLYSLEERKTTQITDGMSDAGSPVFDKNGKQVYFTASTDVGPRVFGFDMSSYPHRPTRSVYLCVLKKDLPSPLAPESDEEKPSEPEAKAAAEKKADAAKDAAAKEPARLTVDFDNISQRILALPVPARNYAGLIAGKANTLFILESGAPGEGTPGLVLHKFDLEKRKFEKVIDGLAAADISANGEKLLYRQGANWCIASLAQPIKPGEGKIRTDEMEVFVEPRAEWNQMYRETWRIERDFFYDPNHHGLDLNATARKYEPYLQALVHRADLNYLFQEMLGELSVGHLYVSGGDVPDVRRVPVGLLGADYRIENGRYRFARVFNGENWNPQLRAPLTQPGINVREGEYLLAVNGRDITSNDNVYRFFEATANRQVLLKVGPNPDGSGAREVTVVPVNEEGALRNLAWIEENRQKVDRLSGGALAYIYLPDTAQGGYTSFNRYFFSQTDKQGAVVDERFNSGGQSADYVIDYLKKPLMSYWAVRDGEDFRIPFGTLQGPKAMIINEYAGSGGDLLPWMFRRSGIGPLIGKRTWGGLIGIGGYPVLMDGGSVTAPHFAFYSPDGKWEIENRGVAPDIETEFDPKAWREGHDLQLEKAVEFLQQEIKKNPLKKTERPPYPNYHKPPTP